MILLEALVEATSKAVPIASRSGDRARVVYFAFAGAHESAFLSEIEVAELVPLIEEWCRQQRAEMVVN